MNVLIVEDEAHTAALLQEIIEQDSDFIVLNKLESIVETVRYLSKYHNKLHFYELLFYLNRKTASKNLHKLFF